MATLSNNDIARAIYLETKGKSGAKLAESLKNSVTFLSREGLLPRASLILESLENVVGQEEGKLTAHVKSAAKLTESTKKEIKSMLSKYYPAKHFTLEEYIQPELLGGVRVEVGNDVIDLSTKNKIKKLETYLKRT